MGLIIIIAIIAMIIYVVHKDNEEASEIASVSSISERSGAASIQSLNQASVSKEIVPPTGRNMSWNRIDDICFALGSFIAGLNAGGWIGAYEDGTLGFDIRNFSSTFNSIHERVPSDVIKFLAENPHILKRKQVGEYTLFEIEFAKTFFISSPRTKENIERAAYDTLKIVQANLLEGAQKTMEITGAGKQLSFRIEAPSYTASKILHIN